MHFAEDKKEEEEVTEKILKWVQNNRNQMKKEVRKKRDSPDNLNQNMRPKKRMRLWAEKSANSVTDDEENVGLETVCHVFGSDRIDTDNDTVEKVINAETPGIKKRNFLQKPRTLEQIRKLKKK